MTRREAIDFVRSGVDQLTPAPNFSTGRLTEFNSQRSNDYPFCWLESISCSSAFENGKKMDDWNISIYIAKIDKMDSSPDEYEALIDDCDVLANKLITKYNEVVSGYKLVTLNSINRDEFIKKFADCLTGVILSFTLNSPDTTNYC